MTATRIIGLLSVVFILGFFAFGFRQGLRAKPGDRDDRGPSVGSPGDVSGDGGHLP
jgi:hypothetical protein